MSVVMRKKAGYIFIYIHSTLKPVSVTLKIVRDTHAHLTLGLNFRIARGLALFQLALLTWCQKSNMDQKLAEI